MLRKDAADYLCKIQRSLWLISVKKVRIATDEIKLHLQGKQRI